jgi:hypothetical protein
MHAGRAQPSMLSTVKVDYFGAPTPLQNLAAVSAPDASTLMIKPFDKSGIKVQFPTQPLAVPCPAISEEGCSGVL